MKKLKSILSIILSLTILSGVLYSSAQNTPPLPNGINPSDLVLVADTSLQDCSYKYSDKIFLIKCIADNGDKPQGSIQFSLTLRNDNNSFTTLLGNPFSLNSKEKRTLEYKIDLPDYLNGKYVVSPSLTNQDSLLLSSPNVGEVEITNNNPIASIDLNSCYIQVVGSSTKYTPLTYGIDVDKDKESLTGSCKITSTYNKSITLTPTWETRLRSPTGPIVENNSKSINNPSITLNANETKEFTLTLPLATYPQAFDSILTLNYEGDKKTNSIPFHYVIRGPSATIQNVLLNKSSYKKGDIANVEIIWSGSADNNPQARGVATDEKASEFIITIKDKDNKNCSDPTSVKADKNKVINTFKIKITRDCIDPKNIIDLKNNNGKTITKREIVLTTQNTTDRDSNVSPQEWQSLNQQIDNANSSILGSGSYSKYIYIALIVLVIIVIGGVVYIKKSDSSNIKN